MHTGTSRRITLAVCAVLGFAAPALAQTVPAEIKEAPSLAARKGELPPAKERVGAEPAVIAPTEKAGKYGGTMRIALRGGGDHNAILRVVGNQGLVRWNLGMTGVVPNVAQSWTVSEDATTYTFKLRRGMKWSDGKPFTADDVVFTMNDLLFNREFNPSPPARYSVNGQPAKVEKVDEVTVRFTFPAPYGRFLDELAVPVGQHPTFYQKAYCSGFHPAYAPADKVAAEARAAGLKDWSALVRQRCGDIEIPARWGNPARPTLDPWTIVEPYAGGATRVVLQRNPYFWQVDTAGNQLPYIDQVIMPVVSDVETILLKGISGELDLQLRHVDRIQNRPVMSENKARGKYEIVELQPTEASDIALYFNLTSKNPKLRELFRNKEFRMAFSHAINRDEIKESVYLGAGENYQVGPTSKHPLHNKQLSYQYLDYDPEKANALLDKIGLDKKDAQGFRLWPDGSKVFFTVDFPVSNPEYGDALNLIKPDLARVGIDFGINAIERTLFYERAQKNEHDVNATLAPGGLDPTLELRTILAEHPIDSRQSLEWQKWYESRGKEGEEPTESMKRRFALLDQWKATAKPEEANRLFSQILQLAADEFEVVGMVRPLARPGIRAANLRNVPSPMINAWTFATPGSALPQQFFFE